MASLYSKPGLFIPRHNMAGILTWKSRFGGVFGSKPANGDGSGERSEDESTGPPKWSMGVLNDPKTIEVPGAPFSLTLLVTFKTLLLSLLLSSFPGYDN